MSDSSFSNQGVTGLLLNSPELSNDLKPKQRSVTDFAQAKRVVERIISYSRERMIINSRITAKANAEKPFQQDSLKAEGLGWKANFTTKPMPMMVEKAYPRFSEAAQAVKYLTNSSLPSHIPGSTYKTEVFRRKFTDMVRSRKGWKTFLDLLSQENCLFGYTTACWLDEYTWFPLHFRQDEFFVPQGTKQNADSAQLIVVKEVFLPHELFEQISDREAAELAGWDVEATVKAINRACPLPNQSRHGEYYRQYEDMRRELNSSFSFENSQSVIEVYNVLAREIDGKVSHYRLAGTDMTGVFQKLDRFDKMSDCASFFAYQQGNGTLHGSKGIGREIYELAAIIDRNRNEIVDRLMLSGKVIIQTEEKNVKKFRMSVVGNAILIGRGFTVLEQAIDGKVEPFLQLDGYLSLIIDQLIGVVSPRQLQGERVTKAQVDLFAAREEEAKDTKISRFLEQFICMIGTLQRRALNPDTTEEDAKTLQKELLEVMSKEEIEMLRNAPVAGTVDDLTPIERQQVVLIAQENQGNPLYNQRALQEEKLIAQLGHEFADKVLLPDEDPTVQSEQTRLQQIEVALLSQGQGVPVSPRDNHEIHLGIIMPLLEQIAPAINEGQASTGMLEVLVKHGRDHYNYAVQQGAQADQLGAVQDMLNKLDKALVQLKQLDAQAQTIAEAGGALQQQSAQEDEMAAQSLALASVPDKVNR